MTWLLPTDSLTTADSGQSVSSLLTGSPFDVVDVATLVPDGRIKELHIVYDTVDVRPAFEDAHSCIACAGTSGEHEE